jgi:hypothetical protein
MSWLIPPPQLFNHSGEAHDALLGNVHRDPAETGSTQKTFPISQRQSHAPPLVRDRRAAIGHKQLEENQRLDHVCSFKKARGGKFRHVEFALRGVPRDLAKMIRILLYL